MSNSWHYLARLAAIEDIGPQQKIIISSDTRKAHEAEVATLDLEHVKAALASAELEEMKKMVDPETTSLLGSRSPDPPSS